MTGYSLVSKGFKPKFNPKLIQSSQFSSSQAEPKIQKDYKAEYKKIKSKLALLKASPSTSQTPKRFQSNNKSSVAETFDWDEEEVSDDEEVTEVNVLMALIDDELSVGNNHARNGSFTKLRGNVIEFSTPLSKREIWLSETEPTTPSVPTEVKNTKQESKINELTKLVQMLIDERVFNTRRQQVEKNYHVTFDESMEAIRFTNTSVNEIEIDDSSRYPPDNFIHEDDPSIQYQANSDISYYVIPHGRSLTKLTQEKHVPEVIAPNEPDIPHTEDAEGPLGQNTEVLVSIIESSIPDVPESHISNQASISSHPAPQDRWSKDQHIELVNIIGDPYEGMLIRSMAAKLTVVSASKCLFADFLFEIEPKKVSEALKHLRWVDAMQEELNQFYINKVWTLVPLPYGKTTIGSKWEKGIDYDETFAPVPLGFESSEFLDYVCKLEKALYGLKHALRAWYETLSTFLVQNKFAR
ncbi:retrovirus-related pol polyprotein from transposon TNT 1-94 [Tanacetum coccineum]